MYLHTNTVEKGENALQHSVSNLPLEGKFTYIHIQFTFSFK